MGEKGDSFLERVEGKGRGAKENVEVVKKKGSAP